MPIAHKLHTTFEKTKKKPKLNLINYGFKKR